VIGAALWAAHVAMKRVGEARDWRRVRRAATWLLMAHFVVEGVLGVGAALLAAPAASADAWQLEDSEIVLTLDPRANASSTAAAAAAAAAAAPAPPFWVSVVDACVSALAHALWRSPARAARAGLAAARRPRCPRDGGMAPP